jgi:hypothetical protein
MIETCMPLGVTNGSGSKGTLECRKILRLDGIEARLTSPVQQIFPGLMILYRKMPRMILKKDIIITGKFMNG